MAVHNVKNKPALISAYLPAFDLAGEFLFDLKVNADGKFIYQFPPVVLKRLLGGAGTWPDGLHPDDFPALNRFELDLFANQPGRARLRFLRKDGSIREVRFFASPVMDESTKKVVAAVGLGHDLGCLDEKKGHSELYRQEYFRIPEGLEGAVSLLTSTIELDEVLYRILDNIGQVVHYDAADIILVQENGLIAYHRMVSASPGLIIQNPSPLQGFFLEELPALKKVSESERVVVIQDTRQYPGWKTTPGREFIRSILISMMRIGGRVAGFISLMGTGVNCFSEEQAQRLSVFTNYAAVAVKNASVFDKTRRKLMLAETLREAVAAVTTALTMKELIERVLEQLEKVISFDSCSVQIPCDENMLEIVGGRGFKNPEEIIGLRIPFSQFSIEGKMILQEHEVFICDDLQAVPGFVLKPPHAAIRSWMVVPVLYQKRLLGVITYDSYEPNHFTAEDASVAAIFSQYVAMGMENARLFEETRQGMIEAETLRKAAAVVASAHTLYEVVEQILEQLGKVVAFDSGSVFFLENDHWVLRGGKGFLDINAVLGASFGLDDDVPMNEVRRTLHSLIVPDAHTWEIFKEPPHDRIRSWMGIPIVFQNRLIGCLSLDSEKGNFFTEEHARFAAVFADHAAVIMEGVVLFEKANSRAVESETLRQAGFAVAATLNQEESIQRILEQLERVVSYDSASVRLVKEDWMEVIAARGIIPAIVFRGQKFSIMMDNPDSIIYNSAQPLIINDTCSGDYPMLFSSGYGLHSWMGVPLMIQERVIGAIVLSSFQKGRYKQEHARLVMAFANQVAVAVENARLYTSLQYEFEERKRLEAAMIESRKQAALGTLVAGIAHEINSPLQTITALSDSLLGRVKHCSEDINRDIEIIDQNAWRIAQIVQSLVSLGVPTNRTIELQDVNQLIIAALLAPEFSETLSKEIEFVLNLYPELPRVECEVQGIRQVFSSILQNAYDAISRKGKISICTYYEREKKKVAIEISDDGEGITDENLKRIFEPFFTTRPIGKIGLGLSLAQSIIASHGGEITVESTQKRGTLVCVYLPEKPLIFLQNAPGSGGRYDG